MYMKFMHDQLIDTCTHFYTGQKSGKQKYKRISVFRAVCMVGGGGVKPQSMVWISEAWRLGRSVLACALSAAGNHGI